MRICPQRCCPHDCPHKKPHIGNANCNGHCYHMRDYVCVVEKKAQKKEEEKNGDI